MKFFKRFHRRPPEQDAPAMNRSKELLEELERTEPEIDRRHEVALERLTESAEQARKLKDADRRNHYSESLTHAFRGRLT